MADPSENYTESCGRRPSRKGIPRAASTLDSFADALDGRFDASLSSEQKLWLIEREIWEEIKMCIPRLTQVLRLTLDGRVKGKIKLVSTGIKLVDSDGAIIPYVILCKYYSESNTLTVEELSSQLFPDSPPDIIDALRQSCVLTFTMLLKKAGMTLNLRKVLSVRDGAESMDVLLQKARNRIFKKELPVNSILVHALVNENLGKLADSLLVEDMALHITDVYKKYRERMPALDNLDERFIRLLEHQALRDKALNIYGRQGKASNFDIEFRKMLLEVLRVYYQCARSDSYEELVKFINTKLGQLLSEFSFYEDRDDTFEKKCAIDLNRFMDDVVLLIYGPMIEEESKKAKLDLISTFANYDAVERHLERAINNSIPEFFLYLTNMTPPSQVPDGLGFDFQYQRNKVLALLFYMNPDVAIEHGFRIEVNSISHRTELQVFYGDVYLFNFTLAESSLAKAKTSLNFLNLLPVQDLSKAEP